MYPNVYLIKGLFEEAEIANFTKEDIELLGELLDDKLSLKVLEMIDRNRLSPVHTDPNDWAVHLSSQLKIFEEMLYEPAKKYTYHLEAASLGYIEAVKNLTLDTVYELYRGNLGTVKNMLENLLANRKYWATDIAPRQKKNFERFLVNMGYLSGRTSTMISLFSSKGITLNHCEQFERVLKANRAIFYGQYESLRTTGMNVIFNKETDMRIALHGLYFRDRVSNEKVTKAQWRRI